MMRDRARAGIAPFGKRYIRLARRMIGSASSVVLLLAASAANANTDASDLAIVGVSVVDVRSGLRLQNRTIVIREGIIERVDETARVRLAADMPTVDGRGRFLIPGLWDMHVHTSTHRVTRDILFPLFIANGVTGIRIMGADCFESSPPDCNDPDLSAPLPSIREVRGWRRAIRAGALTGPRIVAGSFNLHGTAPGETSTSEHPGTSEHARAHVAVLETRGVDFAKVYSGFPREAYFALMDEARRRGFPVAGHVPAGISGREASEAGQASIEHIGPGHELLECTSREASLRERLVAELSAEQPDVLPILMETVEHYDESICRDQFRAYASNGTWVTPTLVLAPMAEDRRLTWRDDPRSRFLSREEHDYWSTWGAIYDAVIGTDAERYEHSRWVRRVARQMHEEGVRFLAGTDAGYPGIYWGDSLHEELDLLVEAVGLTPAEALQAATSAPAAFLGLGGRLGAIEPGMEADLVLLTGDPIDDIGNVRTIEGVMAMGRWYDRLALDGLLASATRAAASMRQPRPAPAMDPR